MDTNQVNVVFNDKIKYIKETGEQKLKEAKSKFDYNISEIKKSFDNLKSNNKTNNSSEELNAGEDINKIIDESIGMVNDAAGIANELGESAAELYNTLIQGAKDELTKETKKIEEWVITQTEKAQTWLKEQLQKIVFKEEEKIKKELDQKKQITEELTKNKIAQKLKNMI